MSAGAPLDAEAIRRLLSGKRTIEPKKPKPDDTPARFETDIRPNPVTRTQAGYPQPGEKGDIWAEWIRRGRTGATEIIERWT